MTSLLSFPLNRVKILFQRILLLFAVILFSANAFAVTGVYKGTLSGTETQFSPSPGAPLAISSDFSITITELTFGGSIVGSGEIVSGDFAGSIFSLSGTVSTLGVVTVTFNDSDGLDTSSGSFAGTIDSSTFIWNVSITGSDITTSSGNLSNFSASGIFNFTETEEEGAIETSVTPSSTVTEAVLFNTQIYNTISDVSSHVSGALAGLRFSGGPRFSDNQFKVGGATGLNAGDGFVVPYGVWGSYSYTDYENDLSSTAFDGTSHGFLGGIDFGFWESTVLGVAFGYDSGDIDTTFNRGNQQTDTFTIAPYFGALLSDKLSLDFMVGYSKVDYDQFRIVSGGTTRITSAPNADRWFGALNLNAVTYYDKWIIGGRVGASYASSQIDSYTESNSSIVADSRTRLSTMSLAGDVAYSYGDYEPFLNLSYQNDFQLRKLSVTTGPQPSNDSDDILMTTGVRYFSKNGVTGNLEYSKRFLRDDFDEDRISMTIRADF